MARLDILKDWYDRVLLGGDMAAIAEFFPPGVQAMGIMPSLSLGSGDFAELIPAMKQLVIDLGYTVERHVEAEDWLWALIRFHGRAARTLAPIDITAQVAVRFAGGRFVEAHNTADMLSFFEQIGALPADTMALCLMGEQLR
jgi:hypothetical protein